MRLSFYSYFLILMMLSCNNPQPRKPILRKSSSTMQESVQYNKSLIAIQENIFKELMKTDSLNNYIASDYGFWYSFNLKTENTYFPKTEDEVLYSYEIFDVNNQLIYSENEIGIQSYIVDKEEVVEGLREGLKLMNVGDNATFLFPSHKVFGYLGDQNKIRVNQPLIYKVQLIKINKKNESN